MGVSIERVASSLSYTVATLLAWLGMMSPQDLALMVGTGVGVATFLVNWHYRRKSFQLLAESRLCKNDYEHFNH
ncbi:HP1 family phage holin [Chimaeribacter californicus]|uniref:HP1 family phage holin n=1 Tax=Chimaeribacter californicus TaxID=2060067 RepID=UPI0026B8FA5E